MTSVEAGRFLPVGVDRGPLWRRSAFRSAMDGWRDFVLRESFHVLRAVGGSPGRICGTDRGFA
ncbi:MAG: hypothetical protein BGN91_07135 [Nitrobacter sp. 62-13]|nr:MAG: hypothetical protein BGN91_07135 [Nitrobacter sp. 62-13]